MKYIFVAGLEHSGTTLLSQLLAEGESTLALGEVGQFLSRSRMENYLADWGAYPDATRCSCGSEWAECPVWRQHMPLCGSFENHELAQGYETLIARFKYEPGWPVLVDSSKSLQCLDALRSAWTKLGQPASSLLPVVVAKDPRGFADSIARKSSRASGVGSHYRTMNWWRGTYERLLAYLDSSPRPIVVTYKSLCDRPGLILDAIRKALEIEASLAPKINHHNSHIALGNKNFTERNRDSIRYDDRWKNNMAVKFAYGCNWRARRLYGKLCVSEQAQLDHAAI